VNVARKTIAALLLALVAVALAQQDSRTGLIAYQGSQDIWNQHWSSGTRTDMAPKFEVGNQQPPNVIRAYSAEDARKACEAQVSGREVETARLVEETQNSDPQLLPVIQPIINSMSLQAARGQAKKDCERAGVPSR